MMTPAEYDAILGHLMSLDVQVQSAIRTLQLMKPDSSREPKPIQDHAPRERVHKVFGNKEYRIPISPDEAAAAATAPASEPGYISNEEQGSSGSATSGKADDSGQT